MDAMVKKITPLIFYIIFWIHSSNMAKLLCSFCSWQYHPDPLSQMLLVWNIYLHLCHFWGKCRYCKYSSTMEHLGMARISFRSSTTLLPWPHVFLARAPVEATDRRSLVGTDNKTDGLRWGCPAQKPATWGNMLLEVGRGIFIVA